MFEWLTQNEDLLLALGIFSAVCFVASLVLVPALIVRIPRDYFAHSKRVPPEPQHPAVRIAVLVLKNLIGAVLVVAGIAMLVLPGQGILTILVGMFLLNFPGKYALERRLVRQPAVLRALNWIRAKADRPPLLLD